MSLINYRKLFVHQLSANDCGCASLATVCKYYHFDVSLNQIKHIAKPQKGRGSSIWELGKVAEEIGFEVQPVKLSPSSFEEDFSLPAIIHIKLPDGTNHFVVLLKITGNTIHVMDPDSGYEAYTKEEFWNISEGYCLLLNPTDEFYKTQKKYKDQDKSIIKSFFLDVMNHNTIIFVVSLLVSLLVVLLGIVFSYSFQFVIDLIVADSMLELVSSLIVGFGIVALLKSLFSMLQQHLKLKLDLRVNTPVIEKYYKHILKLPLTFFDNTEIGDIVIRCQDALSIKDFLINTISTITLNTPMIILSSIVMIKISVRMFTIISLTVVISALIAILFKESFQRYVRKEKVHSSIFQNQLIDSLKNIQTVKSYCKENLYDKKLMSSFSNSIQAEYKRGKLMNLQSTLQSLFVNGGNLALLGISAVLIVSSTITSGTMMTFFSVSSLFFDSILVIVSLIFEYESFRVSCKRVAELYSENEEDYHEHDAKKDDALEASGSFDGSIRAENVSFGYAYQMKTIDNASISIKAGSKVAFVGESGSGKTTFAKIVAGFYKATEGRVLIDGKDIDSVDKHTLRKHISVVAQRPEMFADSVMYNLLFDSDDKDAIQKVQKAIEDTGAEKIANAENACDLSQGEQQKLSIMRALVSDGDIFILDEATSNLDCFGERKVVDLFLKKKNKTVVFISHKLSLVKDCDQIFVFKEGKIVESGNHKELLSAKGQYAKMWNEQNGPLS